MVELREAGARLAAFRVEPNPPVEAIERRRDRRVRRRQRQRRAVAVGVAVAVTLVLVASVSALTSHSPTRVSVSSPTSAVSSPTSAVSSAVPAVPARLQVPAGDGAPAKTLLSGEIGTVYAGPSGLYVQLTGPATPPFDLLRVDPATGAIEAQANLADHGYGEGTSEQMIEAEGSLWVIESITQARSFGPYLLYELDPATLQTVHQLSLPAGTYPAVDYGSRMAVAGGWLWVAHGSVLSRVSMQTATVTATVANQSGELSALASDAKGDALVDTATPSGPATGVARLQRRDPATGAVQQQTSVRDDLGEVEGVVDDGIWTAVMSLQGSGLGNYRLGSLAPTGAAAPAHSKTLESATAQIYNGLLWVQQGPDSYCANPVTGQPLASFGTGGTIVAVGATDVYSVPAGDSSGALPLQSTPIDPRCHT